MPGSSAWRHPGTDPDHPLGQPVDDRVRRHGPSQGGRPADAREECLDEVAILTPKRDVPTVPDETAVSCDEAQGVCESSIPFQGSLAIEATVAALVLPQRRPSHVPKTTVTFRGASYAGVSLLCETLRPILSHTPNVTHSAAIWNVLAVA